jgi:hypothetical protein
VTGITRLVCSIGEFDMITVTRMVVSEDELEQRLTKLAARYNLPNDYDEESAADQMSDFDAIKWLSLQDQLAAARRKRHSLSVKIASRD